MPPAERDGSSFVAAFVLLGIPAFIAAFFIMVRYGTGGAVAVGVIALVAVLGWFAGTVLTRLTRIERRLGRDAQDRERNGS